MFKVITFLCLIFSVPLYSASLSSILLGKHYCIPTRLPVSSYLYTDKNPVPAVVHTQKRGDQDLSRKNPPLFPGGEVRGGRVPTVMSGTTIYLQIESLIIDSLRACHNLKSSIYLLSSLAPLRVERTFFA